MSLVLRHFALRMSIWGIGSGSRVRQCVVCEVALSGSENSGRSRDSRALIPICASATACSIRYKGLAGMLGELPPNISPPKEDGLWDGSAEEQVRRRERPTFQSQVVNASPRKRLGHTPFAEVSSASGHCIFSRDIRPF